MIVENWYSKSGLLNKRDINGKTDYIKTEDDTASRSFVDIGAGGERKVITKDEYDNITKIQYADGSEIGATYSSVHGGKLSETDALGTKTQYNYDAKGNLIKITEAVGLIEQRTTEYVRNEFGQVSSVTRKGSTVTLKNGQTVVVADATWQFEYSPQGLLNRMISPAGEQTSFTHSVAGDLISYTDGLNRVTQYQVNAFGWLTSVIDSLNHTSGYSYDNVGNLTSYTDSKGKEIKAEYDARNDLIKTIGRAGGVETTEYNGLGMPVRHVNADGHVNQSRYDNLMRISEVIDGLGNTTTFRYPATSTAGQSQMQSNPSEVKYPTYSRQYQYDQFGQVVQATILNPDNADASLITSEEGLIDTYKYNKRGQVVETTDANGKTSYIAYDALGRISEMTDSLGHSVKATWDTHNNLIELNDYRGKSAVFSFDLDDRLIEHTLPQGQKTRYSYDVIGNVSSITDAEGNVIHYEYDALDRISHAYVDSSNASVGEASPALDYTYTYDGESKLIGWSDGTQSATYTFDDADRLLSETTQYGNNVSLSYSYTYTAAGYKKTWGCPS